MEFDEARAVLAALARIKPKDAALAVAPALDDVRLRAEVAATLGALGDRRARGPLLAALERERYVSARPHEARALLALGARDELAAPLARFAGLPEPMTDALELARQAGVLTAPRGGWSSATPAHGVDVSLRAPAGPSRLLLLASAERSDTHATHGGAPLALRHAGPLRYAELASDGGPTELHLEDDVGLIAAWLVPRTEEPPPPPPIPWDAGPADSPELR
jgi:hypothetical protein